MVLIVYLKLLKSKKKMEKIQERWTENASGEPKLPGTGSLGHSAVSTAAAAGARAEPVLGGERARPSTCAESAGGGRGVGRAGLRCRAERGALRRHNWHGRRGRERHLEFR